MRFFMILLLAVLAGCSAKPEPPKSPETPPVKITAYQRKVTFLTIQNYVQDKYGGRVISVELITTEPDGGELWNVRWESQDTSIPADRNYQISNDRVRIRDGRVTDFIVQGL